MLANTDIRTKAKNNKVSLWEIADKLKISEPTMTRRMRKELSDKDKTKILSIINEIAAEKKAAAV